jgi:hypothetical protein
MRPGAMRADPTDHALTMPSRFYFHLVKQDQRITDRTGIELEEGTVMSRAMLKVVRTRWPGTSDVDAWKGWSVEIADEQGRIVRTIALDELA